jgi:hypothetical protein
LAATQTLPVRKIESNQPRERFDPVPLAVTAGLTVLAVLIHGYHPYAEDGGIYLPGVLKLVHPDLYPTWSGFVTAQMRFSFFAPLIAGVVRLTGLSVVVCFFFAYLLSIWGTLYAAWQIIARCARSREASFGAVLILALCMSAPAAGTSLLLVDPYVTARSISTPFGLFALAAAIDVISEFKATNRIRAGRLALCAGSLLMAALMHPLMACYAAGCVVLLVCASINDTRFRIAAFGAVGLFVLAVAAMVELLAPGQPTGYATVALSRHYWFLSAWQWYEIAGLVAPLVVLWAINRRRTVLNNRGGWLVQTAIAAGCIGITVSLLFAHQSAHTYFVAMLQPLRIYQTIYILVLLVVGAFVTATFLEGDAVRWAAMSIVLGALMLCVQLETFPHSAHIELPHRGPVNAWEQGFVWIAKNTPTAATFALDSKYIESQGEDAQNFRALAERSSPPDYTKDAGIAAIDPGLTSAWMSGEALGDGLSSESDTERRRKLAGARVQWVVLPEGSATGFDCPYRNQVMKVCRVPNF